MRTMRAPGSTDPPSAATASMFPPPRQRPLPGGGNFLVRIRGPDKTRRAAPGGGTAPPPRQGRPPFSNGHP